MEYSGENDISLSGWDGSKPVLSHFYPNLIFIHEFAKQKTVDLKDHSNIQIIISTPMKQFWKKIRRLLSKALTRNHYDLAYRLCNGDGLEIGAMSSPYIFSSNCKVKYADIASVDELKVIINKIPSSNYYRGNYPKVDHILQGPKYGLDFSPDNNFDFVYSSNSLEHTPNPIWALVEQLRVVKSGGGCLCLNTE